MVSGFPQLPLAKTEGQVTLRDLGSPGARKAGDTSLFFSWLAVQLSQMPVLLWHGEHLEQQKWELRPRCFFPGLTQLSEVKLKE